MKIYFKTSTIIILSLLFTNCRKESTSYLQRAYEEAVKLHQEGNLNDAVFYYQLTALNCQYHPGRQPDLLVESHVWTGRSLDTKELLGPCPD